MYSQRSGRFSFKKKRKLDYIDFTSIFGCKKEIEISVNSNFHKVSFNGDCSSLDLSHSDDYYKKHTFEVMFYFCSHIAWCAIPITVVSDVLAMLSAFSFDRRRRSQSTA